MRNVVVTTDASRRGVFAGKLERQDGEGNVRLLDARMCVYWSTATRGVLGLAAIGPQEGSRIGPAVPSIELNGVTAVIDMTDEAVKKWEEEPWS